jgi:phage shock protein PspC (stress-responsive transcriptional regulator)
MEKTININLGGILFQIEEDAYQILKNYLQSINNKFRSVPGGAETIDDIESRIAEIFQSQKGLAGIITRENVEAMISIIGKPEDFGQAEGSSGPENLSSVRGRKMFRNPDDRIIGGVCGGLGAYLNTDPVWIRVLFVLFTFVFAIGLFVYLALWISMPLAVSELQKKDMYGSDSYLRRQNQQGTGKSTRAGSELGHAINEIFRAVGKVFYVFARIILIITGVAIMITGFLGLAAFIMVFLFNLPSAFTTDAGDITLSYLPDFLAYVVSPVYLPWIKALITIVVSLPLLAMIYGGIRLIFWFSARDGVVWITGIIIWAVSAAVLSVMLFNEGLSMADSAKLSTTESFLSVPDTLYLVPGNKVSDLLYDSEIRVPDENYNIYISEEKKEVYIETNLKLNPSDKEIPEIEVIKRSAGRNRHDAMEKAERLVYNCSISGDTLFVDEYFTIPSGTKWSFDNVGANIRIPEGTVVYIDMSLERQLRLSDNDLPSGKGNHYWIMTEGKLEPFIRRGTRIK